MRYGLDLKHQGELGAASIRNTLPDAIVLHKIGYCKIERKTAAQFAIDGVVEQSQVVHIAALPGWRIAQQIAKRRPLRFGNVYLRSVRSD